MRSGMRKTKGLVAFLFVLATVAGANLGSGNANAASTCNNTKAGATIIDRSYAWTTGKEFQNGMFCIRDSTYDTELSYQTDGNLVWYIKGVPYWSSNTMGTGAYLALQSDGNIGVYNASGQPVYGAQLNSWAFRTTSANEYKFLGVSYVGDNIGRYQLTHQINLVPGTSNYITASSNIAHTISDTGSANNCSAKSVFSWDLGRSLKPGEFCLVSGSNKLIFQADGNLVHYVNGVARWSTNTSGRGATLAFQADGNIGIYNSAGNAVWGFQATLSRPFQAVDLYYNNGSAQIGIGSDNRIYIQSGSPYTGASNYNVF